MKLTYIYTAMVAVVWCSIQPRTSAQLPEIRWRTLDHRHGFPQVAYGEGLLQDQFGRIWIAYETGLYCYDGFNVVKYTNDPQDSTSLISNNTTCLFQDDELKIWVGTRSSGISIYDPETDRFRHIRSSSSGGPLTGGTIWGFYEDENEILWLSCELGLLRHDRKSGSFDHYTFDDQRFSERDLRYYNSLREIVQDPLNPDRLFVGTRGGLLTFDRKDLEFTHHAMPYSSISEINLDAKEYLVICLIFSSASDLWMGTWGGGIMHYNTQSGAWERFRNPDIRDGIDVERRLMPFGSTKFWVVSHYGGLGIFDLQLKSYNYYTHDPDNPHSYPEFHWTQYATFTDDSTMIALGTDGIAVSDPYPGHRPQFENHRPFLSRILINGTELPLDSSIAYTHNFLLNEDENNLSFEITWPVFQKQDEIHYQCMLSGFDTDWIDNGNSRIARYPNLRGGRYVFHYRASRDGRNWIEGHTTPGIAIRVPFWKKPLFILLAIAVLAVALYLVYRLRILQVRREESLKTEFNKKLASQEMAALRAQMNPHFMFNALNSIKTYILKEKTQEASAYLTKFSQLMRSVLRNSKYVLVPLREELKALCLYVELESLRFEDEFDYSIDIDEGIDQDQTLIPPLLIQPYVENAIRHGLLEKQYGPRTLTIRVFNGADNMVRISVIDNGIGRTNASAKASLNSAEKKSFGMQITRDRIELIRETLGIDASVHVDDLHDAHGSATGTAVHILIPLMLAKDYALLTD